jgi:RNA polymerase sigma factor (sigma-70 family)
MMPVKQIGARWRQHEQMDIMPTTFDEFYAEHRSDAVRWAVALVGDRGVAEDLAQDCLLAVGNRLGRVDDPAAYLRRSVVNRCASWHRSQRRERRRVERVGVAAGEMWTADTAEMLDLLSGLPYQQRAAVTLRYWADWTDADIAHALGTADATVRVLIHRAVQTLRQQLREEESP